MSKRALLVLTQSLPSISSNLNHLVEQSVKQTSERLFVFVNPLVKNEVFNEVSLIEDRYMLRNIMKRIYHKAWYLNSRLDVQVMLFNCLKSTASKPSIEPLSLNYELILTDLKANSEKIKEFCFAHFLTDISKDHVQLMSIEPIENKENNVFNSSKLKVDQENDLIFMNKSYENGIAAGTFDRLHVGHKILLSEAVMLMQKKLLIGITTDEMNKKKVLNELIEPLETRIERVTQFLNTIDSSLEVEFAKLYDPFGPSITEKDYSVNNLFD